MRALMIYTSDDEIEAIGIGFLDRTLPKREWTHAAHFAAALWLLARRPEPDPLLAMPGLIRAYNEATGVANTATGGYHETITLASILAARAFVAAHAAAPLFCVCNDLLGSRFGSPEWLLAHWSPERLFSREARARWVAPDKEDLPF